MRGRWLTMRWRWAVGLILAAAVGLGALQITFSSGALSGVLVPLVQPVLEDRLGPGATVGAVSIHLLPPALVLDHIVVPRPPGYGHPDVAGLPLLTAKRTTSSILPWRPLDLTVEEPVLVVSGSIGRLERLVTAQPGHVGGRTRLRHGMVTLIDPVSGRRLDLTAVDADLTTGLPGADLSVTAQRVGVSLHGVSPQFAVMTARLRVTLNTVQVLALEFSGPQSHAAVTGTVDVGPSGTVRLDLALNATLDLNDLGQPGGFSGKTALSAKIEGSPASPEVRGAVSISQLTREAVPAGVMAGTFVYRDRNLLMSEFSARLADARLTGPVELTLGRLTIPAVEWRGRPLGALTADLGIEAGRLVIHRAVLGPSPTIYRARGEVILSDPAQPVLDIRVDVEHLDPKVILGHDALKTKIAGQGSLTGPLSSPVSRWTLVLARGRIYGIGFDRGALEMAFERDGVTVSAATFERGRRGHAATGRLTGSGRIIKRELVELEAEIKNWNPMEAIPRRQAATLTTLWAGQRLTGRLHGRASMTGFTLQLDTAAHGRWEVVLGTHTVRFTGVVHQTDVTGRVERAAGYPVQLTAALTGTPLSMILSRFSPPLARVIGGSATGEVRAEGRLSNAKSWTVDATLTSLVLLVGEAELHNVTPVKLTVRNDRIELPPVVLTGEDTSLTLSAEANWPSRLEAYVDGEASLRLLTVLAPHVSAGRGTSRLTLRVSGSPANPEFDGKILAYGGEITSASLNKTLRLSSLGCRFENHAMILDALEGEIDHGRFQAQGRIALGGLKPEVFSVQLRFNEIPVDRPPSVSFVVAGSLLAEGDQAGMDLSGGLTVLRGTYRHPVEAGPISSAISGLVHAAAKTRLNVAISGGQDIRVRYRMDSDPPITLEAPVDLDLVLKGTVEQPILLGKVTGKTGTAYYSRQ